VGQKVNPHGLRVGVIKGWDSKWYAGKDYEKFLLEDIKIREFIKEKLFLSGISKVEIERASNKARISIHTAKPGMVIGRQGSNIELLKSDLKKMTESAIEINIVEVKTPDMDATLVAENIAAQLERRIAFRRAMKQCVGRTMRMGAKGIKITCGGRLGAANPIVKAAFLCIPCVLTSIMALQKHIPLMAVSALRYGFTKVKFFLKAKKQLKLLRQRRHNQTCYYRRELNIVNNIEVV
jgi:small subunit ribosomal protein S3